MFFQNLNAKLPANSISNREFCFFTDGSTRPDEFNAETADQWIFERSGIRMRSYLDPKNIGTGICAPELEVDFVTGSLRHSLSAPDYAAIDAVITVRSNPFHYIPGLSHRILKDLNAHFALPAKRAFTLDLLQPSTGFLNALVVARALPFQSILIVCSEILSPFLNLKDAGTAMLFGDGVASLLVSKKQNEHSRFKVIDEHFTALPDTSDVLKSDQNFESFHMKGPELFRKVVPEFRKSAEYILGQNGLSASDIQHYLPHQANRRMIERAASSIGFAPEQLLTNIEFVGNLSSASIPTLLAAKSSESFFKAGERILLNTCGAGLSSGAAILEAIR